MATRSGILGKWWSKHSARSAPSFLGGMSGSRPVAGDLVAEAAKRLQILALVIIGLWCVDILWGLVLEQTLVGTPLEHLLPAWKTASYMAMVGGSWVLSVALYLVARSGRIASEKLLDLGLVYMVLVAFFGSLGETGEVIRAGGANTVQVSWICIWILLYPTLVPNTPRKIFAASMLCAFMDPLIINLYVLHEYGHLAPGVVWLLFMPSYMCAVLAILPAKIVIGLRAKVEEAREMGSYHLKDKLGEGGMGEVWRARHRLLARPAAVKIIRADTLGAADAGAGQAILKRFEREAQATAALRSPHSVQIFDYGLSRDGTFYYVMELLDGLDLDTLVKKFGPLPAARVRALLLQVCHALHDAHAGGLIHRDIKPANLFVCRMGQDLDFVKVLDFGLVKSAADMDPDRTALTMQNQTPGTPAFMAPEMVTGEEDADHRLDLYALGCVAYWLLSGELVFEAASSLDMLVRQAKDEPVPPSRRSELPIPEDLERVIMRCLEKDPARRPADARELSRLLEACRMPEEWGQEQAAEWWHIHLPAQVAARWSPKTDPF